MTDTIKTLGVFGAGTMGTGIAINAVANGITALIADNSEDALTRAKARAEKVLNRWVEKGRMSEADKAAALDLFVPASKAEAAAADLVIEAVFEDLEVKRSLLREIEPHLSSGSVIATNTSALRVADIASALSDPGRVVGLHYFSPAEVNPLCELSGAPQSREDALTKAQGFLEQTQRAVLTCTDTAGFIVNRFFIPVYDEATRLIGEGVATPAQIDAVSKDLFQAGAGIVTVLNVIGARTSAHAAENLAELGPEYAPSDYLKKLGQVGNPIAFDPIEGAVDAPTATLIKDRLTAAILLPVADLINEGIATFDQIDTGARLALKYNRTPGMILDERGAETAQTPVDAHRERRLTNQEKAA